MRSITRSGLIFIIFTLCFNACFDDTKRPSVITAEFSDTTWSYVITGGEVVSDGGSVIIARGVCYNTNGDTPPTINDWHTTDSNGLGSFTSKVNFIYAGAAGSFSQKHYIRAYATNSEGTAYGETISVSPKSRPPQFFSIRLVKLSYNSASFDCNITNGYHNFAIDEFYFCYSNEPNPTVDGLHSEALGDQSNYKLEGLSPDTKYYVRGYIKNESGFVYSPEISFTTSSGEVTDIDGNVYPTKIIGTQEWMASNLIVSKYNDGTTIPTFYYDWDWSVTESGARAANRYNYYAVIDNKKLCPSGWHIPSDEEWKTLEINLGMSTSDADLLGSDRGSDEGGKLKMKSDNAYNEEVWKYPNLGANNSSGFSAKGIGWRSPSGSSSTGYYSTAFWTQSVYDEENAISRSLYYNSTRISRNVVDKNYGLCIRCVKD